jgi:signal peptidase I
MVGDFLFVSKMHYGTRLPMVPLAVPLVHNKLPFVNVKSYLGWIKLPYLRLPGFVNIERNDVVVFNYPADDVRPNNPALGPIDIPSVKENYIKRCVAVPGDVFEIRKGQVFINGKPGYNPPEMQLAYYGVTKGEGLPESALEPLGFRPLGDNNSNWQLINNDPSQNLLFCPRYTADSLKAWQGVFAHLDTMPEHMIRNYFALDNRGFGFDMSRKNWSINNFGPITIPGKGKTIKIDTGNVEIYRRAIAVYEKHELEVKDNKIFIDGKETSEFTFEMDYYFMMGDNRYNSQDSRYWGFVPEDHIVGKPIMVFFSRENGIRWNRIFKMIK